MCAQYVWMDCANGNKQQPMACSPLCSWPGYLYHQISVGHGQVPHQTVAEEHLRDHLQGIPTLAQVPPLLPNVIFSLASVWLQCKQPGTNIAVTHLFVFCCRCFFFPASNSDRQWPEGQSLGLQQPEGKPAEPGEEECVSQRNRRRLPSSVLMRDLRRVTTHCLRLPLGGACWPGVWLTSWRRRTLSWTLSTWLPCWWLCQSKCTSLVMTIRSCSFLLKDELVSVLN